MKKVSLLIHAYLAGCFILLAAITFSAQIAEKPDAVVTNIVGTWKGEGKGFGGSTKVEMKWESVLNKKFVRLQYKTEIQTANGKTQILEGYAFYKSLGNGKYQATWFDSTGDQLPIDASFSENALTANWGTPTTKLGRTIYKLIAPEQIEIADYIQIKDGTWKEFSRSTLKKEENN